MAALLRFASPRLLLSLSKPPVPLRKPLLLLSSPISFQRITSTSPSSRPRSLPPTHDAPDLNPSILPPNLQEIIALFRSVSDPRAKYQQLLHYGSKLPPLDPAFKTEENRVRGCVSRVWVRAFVDPEYPFAVRFEADSDAALTRGLAALLVLGLSGSSPEVIASVPAEFVLLLGIRQSLSESRNNGFLNMLKVMQRKALELGSGAEILVNEKASILEGKGSRDSDFSDDRVDSWGKDVSSGWKGNGNVEETVINGKDEGSWSLESGNGGREERIRGRLQRDLSPLELEVENISHMHAGHAAVRGSGGGETHFNVKVVSEMFEGKSLVKRHRLVYDLLQEELQSGLHALSIDAKAPSEVQTR
ncbi:putative BolA protein [Dioscorea sansibarensis]